MTRSAPGAKPPIKYRESVPKSFTAWRMADLPSAKSASMSKRPPLARLDLQLQQRIGRAVGELRHVGRREPDLVEVLAAHHVRRIRIVDREHHAVDAEGVERGIERRLVENAAGGNPDLVEDGLRHRAL